MEVASADLPSASKLEAESESSMSNGVNHTMPPESGEDDSRSSSLSDIEDALDNEQLDSINPALRKAPVEVDSEAETERIEESPNKVQRQGYIYLSPGQQDKSPSKLMYSTSAGDIGNEPDDAQTPEVAGANSNVLGLTGKTVTSPTTVNRILSPPSDMAGKKRKRPSGKDSNATSDTEAEQPLRKRTGSIKSDANGNNVDEMDIEDDVDDEPRRPEALDEEEPHDDHGIEDVVLAEDLDESDHKQGESKGKRAKKGKRKAKKILDVAEESRAQSEVIPEVSIESPAPTQGEEADHGDEEEEGRDDADDAEAATRNEEELAKRMAAMDALAGIEKQFATFRDKIYDDRVAHLNEELAQLQAPTPTHPEYLAMLKCIEQRRDEKKRLATKLYEYQVKALKTKSVAERSQINGQFFQYNRELRETYMEKVGDEMYRIQRDRWGTEGSTPDYTIKFPTKRSVQIKNQTAYNKEVSILSGVAKYVGFPSAPELKGVTKSELDDDFEKMGIATQIRPPIQPPIQLVRGSFPSSSAIPKASAEEQFLEQTPWANPQHPIHRQHLNRRISEQPRAEDSFTTPAAQKRVVDLTAANGSASTLPEPASGQASSVVNTPADRDPTSAQAYTSAPLAPTISHDGTVESADRMSESRSLPSSPIEQRKAQLPTVQPSAPFATDASSSLNLPRTSAMFNGTAVPATHSPSSSRGTLFSPPPKSEPIHSTSIKSPENIPEHSQASPMSAMKPLPGPGIAAGGGMNGIASR